MQNSIYIGLVSVGTVFLLKEVIRPFFKIKIEKSKCEVSKLMKEENISAERAKEKMITKKIGQIFKIDKDSFEISDKTVKQGDRISFTSSELGFISGEFLGLKESNAEGYTYHFVIKNNENKIIQAPVEVIETDTVMVYQR